MPDKDAAWARASVLSAVGGTVFEVRIDGIDDNDEAGESDWGAGEVRRVDLAGAHRFTAAVLQRGGVFCSRHTNAAAVAEEHLLQVFEA